MKPSLLVGMVVGSSTTGVLWVTRHGRRKLGEKWYGSEKTCFTLAWASSDDMWNSFFASRFSDVFSGYSLLLPPRLEVYLGFLQEFLK
jgi:hypothetical protein